MADEAQKLNNTYMRIDYSLFASNDGKPLTKSAILLGGFIGTFSKEDKFGNVVKRCWAKYSRFENALGLSSATIWRSKSELADYIKCIGQSQYVLRDNKASNRHLRLPYYFLNESFNIEREGRDRKLSRSELAVLMLFYSECCLYDNDVYHYEEITTSYKKIGKDLNLNEKTVRKAINVLQDLKIIWRKNCAMPGMHTFGLKKNMFLKLERHFKKAAKKEVKTSAPSDSMIDRERYYSDLRAKAEMVADRAKDRALRYMPYYNADKEVKKLGMALAFAEVRTPDKAPELEEQLRVAERKRLVALKDLGLTDDDLMPHYTCSKCNDTGWLPNGKACDCYPRE